MGGLGAGFADLNGPRTGTPVVGVVISYHEGMVRDHHPNDRQRSPSTTSSPPQSTAGRKDETLATRGMPCNASVGPEPGESRAVTRAHTYLPGTFQTQSQLTLTRAQEKCDGGRAASAGPRSI